MSGSRSARWRIMSLATRLVIAIAIAAALGFPVFVSSLARATVDPGPADGIVVLTGGEDRLPAAVHLLQAHKGNRLLISGVHQETTRKELLDRVGADPTRAPIIRSASHLAHRCHHSWQLAAPTRKFFDETLEHCWRSATRSHQLS